MSRVGAQDSNAQTMGRTATARIPSGLVYRGENDGIPFAVHFTYTPVLDWLRVPATQAALRDELRKYSSCETAWLAMKLLRAMKRSDDALITWDVDELILRSEKAPARRVQLRNAVWHRLAVLVSLSSVIGNEHKPLFSGPVFKLGGLWLDVGSGQPRVLVDVLSVPYDATCPPKWVVIGPSEEASKAGVGHDGRYLWSRLLDEGL